MKHYVISAVTSHDRRQSIEEEFAKINVTPNFFDAIMGNSLSEEFLQTNVKARHLLKLSEIGCAFSHFALYRKLLESDEQSILIFEDDITLRSNFSIKVVEEARAFINNLNEPAIVLLRGSINQTGVAKELSNEFLIYTVDEEWSGYAYLINRLAAKNLLENLIPLRYPLDIWKYYTLLGYIKLYALNKHMIDSGHKFASIIDENSPRKKPKYFQAELNDYCKRYPLSKRLKIKASRLQRSIMRLVRRVYRNQK